MTLGNDALKWCKALSQQLPSPVEYLGPSHTAIKHHLSEWLKTTDLRFWQDEVGNLWARLPAEQENSPIVILGAELRSDQAEAGILGTILPLLVMKQLHHEAAGLPFHLDWVCFADEQGQRFGASHIGSKAVVGAWDPSWAKLEDGAGTSLANAFQEHGLSLENAHLANRQGTPVLAYLAVQTEPGPVLSAEDAPVGIVTALVGTRRFNIDFEGTAGHAGSVPMHLRQDALAAAAEFTLIVERVAREHGVIATVGRFQVSPDDVGRIADQALISLDIRSEQDSSRDAALSVIWETARLACQERGVRMEWRETRATPAVACADWLQLELAHAMEQNGVKPRYLVGGSRHEASILARLCPMALMYVRRQEGSEPEIEEDDADTAATILKDWIYRLA